MSKFKAGSMSGDELIDMFGLQQGSDVGDGFNSSAGATDDNQTKGNAQLGDGYLTNDQYEKLKNDSNVKSAYASIHGEEAANKKFEDGGISINTMDALFDDLTAEAPKEETPEPEAPKDDGPIEYSDEILQAKERVKTYEDNILSGKTSRDIYGGNQEFKDAYQLKLQNNNKGFMDNYKFNPEASAAGAQDTGIQPTKYQPDEFSGSDISPFDTKEAPELATESFLENQKRKTIKQANIRPVR